MVPGTDYGMFNDLGVYGVPRLVRERKPWDAVTAMRKMEEFTRYAVLSPVQSPSCLSSVLVSLFIKTTPEKIYVVL